MSYVRIIAASAVIGCFVLCRSVLAAEAIFAGGCFWCMESEFEELKGVSAVESGYTGGKKPNPTYAEVSTGRSGHYEAVRVVYDPNQVKYEKLLELFWQNVDPLDQDGQFCDKGEQYASAIFPGDAKERALAEASLAKVAAELRGKGKISTRILPKTEFYRAEESHQDFYKKNKAHYKAYSVNCGREERLRELQKLRTR